MYIVSSGGHTASPVQLCRGGTDTPRLLTEGHSSLDPAATPTGIKDARAKRTVIMETRRRGPQVRRADFGSAGQWALLFGRVDCASFFAACANSAGCGDSSMPVSMRASADSATVQDCRQQPGRCSDRVDAASVCACVCERVRSCVCVCACVRVSCACVCVMCACAIGACHVLCACVWGYEVVVVVVVVGGGGGGGMPACHPRRLPPQSFQHRWDSQSFKHRRTAAVAGSKAGRACPRTCDGRVQRQADSGRTGEAGC